MQGRDCTRCFLCPLSFLLGPTLISAAAVVDISVPTAPQLKRMLRIFVCFSASGPSPMLQDSSQPKRTWSADT